MSHKVLFITSDGKPTKAIKRKLKSFREAGIEVEILTEEQAMAQFDAGEIGKFRVGDFGASDIPALVKSMKIEGLH